MIKLLVIETYVLDEGELELCKDCLDKPNEVFWAIGRNCDSTNMKIVIEE